MAEAEAGHLSASYFKPQLFRKMGQDWVLGVDLGAQLSGHWGRQRQRQGNWGRVGWWSQWPSNIWRVVKWKRFTLCGSRARSRSREWEQRGGGFMQGEKELSVRTIWKWNKLLRGWLDPHRYSSTVQRPNDHVKGSTKLRYSYLFTRILQGRDTYDVVLYSRHLAVSGSRPVIWSVLSYC